MSWWRMPGKTARRSATRLSPSRSATRSRDDVSLRIAKACGDFAEELLGIDLLRLGLGRARSVARAWCRMPLDRLRGAVVRAFGTGLLSPGFRRQALQAREARSHGGARRDGRGRAHPRALWRLASTALGLVPLAAAPTLEGRVEAFAAFVVQRVRHFAQLAYPPNDLGPSGEPGEFPVGVRTLELVDASRMNTDGTGPRPVTVEVWYPSTPEAVAGVERYVVNLFGFDIARTPTYHEVAHAPGPFPLVLFSHGNGGIRFQSIFLAAHLASHGYIVASPDHHGNTFLDIGLGMVDGESATNRPLDMRFMLDELLARNAAAGDFLEGAIDPSRIGMSGHSFGGFTTFALAAGPNLDTRIERVHAAGAGGALRRGVPGLDRQADPDPGRRPRHDDASTTRSRRHHSRASSRARPSSASRSSSVLATSRSRTCARSRATWSGRSAGSPRRASRGTWRGGTRTTSIDYLALNFFDATLNADAAALARLAPANLARHRGPDLPEQVAQAAHDDLARRPPACSLCAVPERRRPRALAAGLPIVRWTRRRCVPARCGATGLDDFGDGLRRAAPRLLDSFEREASLTLGRVIARTDVVRLLENRLRMADPPATPGDRGGAVRRRSSSSGCRARARRSCTSCWRRIRPTACR